jgi:hypothetical protein
MIGRMSSEEVGRARAAGLFGSTRRTENPMDEVLDGERFRRVLARERSHADRGRTSLATLVFSWPDAVREEDVASIVGSIRNRLRDSDVLGWVRRRQIGLLIPGAKSDDALELAKNLYARFEEGVPRPRCMVYPYPSPASRA